MKKFLKVLLIIILIIITIVIGYYAYLKIQIEEEEKRLEKETVELVKLDTDSKYVLKRNYNDMLATGMGVHIEYYEIDFETKRCINKIEEMPAPLPLRDVFLFKEIDKLNYLKNSKKGQIQSQKELTEKEALELKQLLDDIIENKVERINKEEKEENNKAIKINIPSSFWKISTKNVKDIEFNNEELINKFLNLVN